MVPVVVAFVPDTFWAVVKRLQLQEVRPGDEVALAHNDSWREGLLGDDGVLAIPVNELLYNPFINLGLPLFLF